MQIELIKRINADNKEPKNILVIGVFHGDEEQGEYLIRKYLDEKKPNSFAVQIDNNFRKNVLLETGAKERMEAIKNTFQNAFEMKRKLFPKKNNLYYIPRLNPAPTRTNPNGVDLNRNFPTKNWELTEKDECFGGNSPASEEETKFIISLMEETKFDAIITIHAPYKIVNYDGDLNGEALKLAETVSKIVNYPVQKDIGYETKGSFGTYAGVERDIPTITIEVDEEEKLETLYPRFKALFGFLEDTY